MQRRSLVTPHEAARSFDWEEGEICVRKTWCNQIDTRFINGHGA